MAARSGSAVWVVTRRIAMKHDSETEFETATVSSHVTHERMMRAPTCCGGRMG